MSDDALPAAPSRLRVALTQWHATGDVAANLGVALDVIASAAADRPDLILLPENCLALGTNDEMRAAALALESTEIEALCHAARAAGATIVLGGFKRRAADGVHNTALIIGPDGAVAGGYDKIHLFNAVVAGQSFEASRVEQAGDAPLLLRVNGVWIGVTICYDVRFPELYRGLAARGAEVLLVPAAFTYTTGQAHWEVLLRARAIENLAYVVASATVRAGEGATEPFETWGHALAVDPWGAVMADLGTAPRAWRTLELDLGRVRALRKSLPVLASRRPEVYQKAPTNVAVAASAARRALA